jgi:predicted metal-dependent hydrolase
MRRLSSQRRKKILRTTSSIITPQGVVEFELIRSSARRSISITVTESAQIRVHAPAYLEEQRLFSFLRQKSPWIHKKMREAHQNKQYLQAKRFQHGEKYLFLGKKYPLEVIVTDQKKTSIEFTGEKWAAKVFSGLSEQEKSRSVRAQLIDWYKRQAVEHLGGRVFYFSRMMQVEPLEITIRNPKRAWGSCYYPSKKIMLNWQIILSPQKVVDYVIIHELCHLFVHNHSRRFWQKVEKFMPDFRQWQLWLKQNHLDMLLPKV